MNGFLRWLGIAALVLLLAGCIKLDQTLTLNKDGSGTLDIRYGMAEQTIAQLEAMEQMSQQGADGGGDVVASDDGTPFDFDEAEVREKFEQDKPEGVELVSVSSEVVDGWKYIQMQLSFADLEALKRTEFFEDSELAISRNADGNYVMLQKTGADDAGIGAPAGGEDDGMAEAMMQQMATMFAGLRIATSVVAPGEVLESNATSVEGNKATWVFDIDEDPSVLSKLGAMDLQMTFSGEGVDLPELTP